MPNHIPRANSMRRVSPGDMSKLFLAGRLFAVLCYQADDWGGQFLQLNLFEKNGAIKGKETGWEME
jgi:hypothetical protein